jgi:hypothetical protein
MKSAVSLMAILALYAAASAADVAAKFRDISIGAYPPGSRISFTTRDLNAYIDEQIPSVIGPGVRNARVETGSVNIVRGYLDIDFLKVRQAHGDKPNWLMSELLAGERPVAITARISSGQGRCRVDVLSVTVSGIVVEGRTLDFLIHNFVLPTFPSVKIAREFELDYHIDHMEIAPGVVTVVLQPKKG